ncbi:MAG: SCO family protein [Deltaproteobacteria bacterium]|nr:SCO family protein [Deltaproteobacteria bacterium]
MTPSLLAAILALLPAGTPADDPPKDVFIEYRTGARVPGELAFTDHRGKTVTFSQYADGTRPVIVVLAYFNCPLLCTLVLNGLTDGLKELEPALGDGFRVVTVSIDPRDDAELAAQKRANHLRAYGRAAADDGWDFLVSQDGGVRQLADTLGFRYRLDPDSGLYLHAAGAFVLSPDGTLRRTLLGTRFPGLDLRLSLTEAGEGKYGGFADRMLSWCFRYDVRHYEPALDRIALVAAGVAAWLSVLVGGIAWRRSRRAM